VINIGANFLFWLRLLVVLFHGAFWLWFSLKGKQGTIH